MSDVVFRSMSDVSCLDFHIHRSEDYTGSGELTINDYRVKYRVNDTHPC
jgi:hypothetical protein